MNHGKCGAALFAIAGPAGFHLNRRASQVAFEFLLTTRTPCSDYRRDNPYGRMQPFCGASEISQVSDSAAVRLGLTV